MRLISKFVPILITVLIAFVCISCEPVSIFESLDKPDTAKIAEKRDADLVESLKAQKGSPKFYSELTGSEKTMIKDSLTDIIISPTSDTELASEAAVLLAEFVVKTEPIIHDTINSIDAIIDNLTTGSGNADDILSQVIDGFTKPVSSIKDNQDALEDFFDNMHTIADAYSEVSSGTLGGGDIQVYIVAAIFDSILDLYSGNKTAAGAALSVFLQDPQNTDVNEILPPGKTTDDLADMITDLNGKAGVLKNLANLADLKNLSDAILDMFENTGN
ncbi:hypothetical protein K7I13_13490 [Brucepastera parasyntrophica]|uniref:hypothetical protein n=1 Tax=Brucepastera parasyntrophica TaxID=2880008 RepID=UPI00210D3F17|nr:hypothetical protein [Brucepastera parasyntrophica]ULQ59471.1 hypothetical protein K7I13_13490 [Brucepastera parasyntrophica]